jgi:hypothetical protein
MAARKLYLSQFDLRVTKRSGRCAIESALARNFGGSWTVGRRTARGRDGYGREHRYRLGLRAILATILFDSWLPFLGPRRVTLRGGIPRRARKQWRHATAGSRPAARPVTARPVAVRAVRIAARAAAPAIAGALDVAEPPMPWQPQPSCSGSGSSPNSTSADCHSSSGTRTRSAAPGSDPPGIPAGSTGRSGAPGA